MSKSKPRRKKNRPNRKHELDRSVATESVKHHHWTIAVALALLGSLGLILYRNQSNQTPPEDSSSVVFPSQSSPPPETRYAGPAAFTFTLENAALSPDGRVTAWSYGGNDLVLCLGVWGGGEPDLSQQITLSGHTAPIRSLAFSTLGQTIASASADRTVKLWDVASGEELLTLAGHNGEVTAVAFSPDGVSMATGCGDHTIRLWDAYGGLPLVSLSGHTGSVNALAYSEDGTLLASAAADESIKIWDMETGQELGTLDVSGPAPIRAMTFSPTRAVLATCDGGDAVRLWDVESAAEIGRVEVAGTEVLSAAFSPDGTAIAVAGADGSIVVRTLATDGALADFKAPETPVFIQYAGDGSLRWSRFSLEHLTAIGAAHLVGRIVTAERIAEQAIAGFGIPDGMQVELFANESLVANPAAICSDDRGRIFVAETFRFDTEVSLGYAGREIWLLDDLASQTPEDRLAMYHKYQDATPGGMQAHGKFSERIRRLEDHDGDGRADHATNFAEGFSEPLTGTGTGLIARGRELYYTCIPDLWKLTDTDDDGTADQRQVVHTGFGVKASLPHGLHGLAWGPDGKLYFSIGDRGYHITTPEGKTLHNPDTGAVLRCNANGSDLEEVARGFRNPQELAFDQFGNLFTCDNNSNQGDEARLVYIVPGGDSGWRMSYETMPAEYPLGPWNMDKMWETPDRGPAAWILPPVSHIGIGPAGLAYYPGEGLPERYQGHFFLCDFADAPEVSGVRSFAVQANGAGFDMQDEHTFISNILPTDIEFGLDQKIYVSDWIRGATSDGLGRIYTAHYPAHLDAGEVKRTKALFSSGFSSLVDDELIELLHHADLRVRQRAQFALADRGSDMIDLLVPIARESDNLLARLHAIWALGMIGRHDPAAVEPVASLLADENPEVRGQAAKVIGEHRHQSSADALVTLLRDENLRVRSFAAYALGRIEHGPAIEPIVEMLRENNDRDVYLRHAATYALFGIGDADAVATFADDDARCVRLSVLLTLRRFADDRISKFLDDPKPLLVVEAARAIHDLPIQSALGDLARLIQRGGDEESLLRRVINANYRVGQPAQARALTEFVSNADSPEAMKVEAIGALADWVSPPQRDRVLGFVDSSYTRTASAEDSVETVKTVIAPWISRMMESPDAPLQTEMMLAASKLQIEIGELAWLSDSRRDIKVRTHLLDRMAERKDAELDQAIDVALESEAPLLRIHAARLLADLDPLRAVDVLRKIIVEGTIAEQQFAFTTLGTIQTPEVDRLLVQWLSKLRAGQVPPPVKYEIMSAAHGRESGMVREELSSLIGFLSRQPTIPERYQAVLEGGSAERGRMLFENHTGIQCLRCHMAGGKGGKVGPDLSKIGSKFSREYLLESLLAPELSIAKGFEGVLVSTTDGRVLTGTLQEENERELRVVDADGKTLVIAKSEIEQRQGGKSVMPGNLLQLISSSDLRDLVEYLASLK